MNTAASTSPYRIACVSFLNSRPLIDALTRRADVDLVLDVPAQLLPHLEARRVEVALTSVVDYQLAQQPLQLLPVGMIGCNGHTLTVRLFSRVPVEQIRTLSLDAHSHTSNILVQLILRGRYHSPLQQALPGLADADARLLIGDKVVTAAPTTTEYPYQLDLGHEWKEWTGLPFVFAMWMGLADVDLSRYRPLLAEAITSGLADIDGIITREAQRHGWPTVLAKQYLMDYLRFIPDAQALAGLREFFQRAAALGLLSCPRAVDVV
ncbi:MAG: menaquinone biosynthesis protein [Phycisphaerae bacterium]